VICSSVILLKSNNVCLTVNNVPQDLLLDEAGFGGIWANEGSNTLGRASVRKMRKFRILDGIKEVYINQAGLLRTHFNGKLNSKSTVIDVSAGDRREVSRISDFDLEDLQRQLASQKRTTTTFNIVMAAQSSSAASTKKVPIPL
jgi:adenine specific DNA methylase Mod